MPRAVRVSAGWPLCYDKGRTGVGRISSIARTSVAKMRSGQAIVEELILAAGCHPD